MDEQNDSLIDIIKKILAELKRINSLDFADIHREWQEKAKRPTIPSLLNGVFITPKFARHITELQKAFYNKNSHLKKIYQSAEFNKVLGNEIIEVCRLLSFAQSDNDNAEKILKELNNKVKEKGEMLEGIEHTFGCTLSETGSDIPKFSIGPVSFQTRLSWLKDKYNNKSISKNAYLKVKGIWKREKVDEIEESRDTWYVDPIIDTIGEANFVCSVKAKGLSFETGKEKALMATRLALTVISLIWDSPSKALDGFRIICDGPTYSRHSISFSESGNINSNAGISHEFPQSMSFDEWKYFLKKYENIFNFAGCVFDYFLNPLKNHKREKVLDSILHSFIWMSLGCREENKLIAIVKFAACLDALTQGKRLRGIKKLVEKQLNVSCDEPLFKNDFRTLGCILEEIFKECRSRTLHGTSENLVSDWSNTRDIAEFLCTECLFSCLFQAAEDENLEDPKEFYE